MNTKISYPQLTSDFNNLHFHILENGIFSGDTSWFFNDVNSSFNRLYFIIDGNAYIENSVGKYDLKPGKLYLIPSGSQYTYGCTSHINKFYLHFELQILPGVDVFEGIPNYIETAYDQNVLNNIMNFLYDESISGILQIKSAFYTILSELFNITYVNVDFYKNFSGYFKQKKILEFINNNLRIDLQINDIASAFDLPYYRISKNFKMDTGIGLKAYIEKMIFQKSKIYLLSTTMTIGEIADKLHFCDAYYFSRFFKKFEYVSPKEYRYRHMKPKPEIKPNNADEK